MKISEQLRYHAQQIDNRIGPIPGAQADHIAEMLRQSAEIAEAAEAYAFDLLSGSKRAALLSALEVKS